MPAEAGFEIERIAVRGFGSAVLAQTSVRSRSKRSR